MYLFKKIPSYFLIVILLFAISCGISDSNSGETQQVSVDMQVNSSTNSTAKQPSSSPTAQSVDSLTEIKLLVEELELESSADDDSLDLEVDDFVVDLPLDGSEFNLASANVPSGIYEEFEMEFEYSDDTNVNDSDFIKESGDDDGYTIVIKGIYNGEEFMYRSEEDFEIELEFEPPFEVNDNSSSIAINIDPAGWFKDSSGNDLDPNDSSNSEQIDENIGNSFDVEEDDDNDDDDDDDGDDD